MQKEYRFYGMHEYFQDFIHMYIEFIRDDGGGWGERLFRRQRQVIYKLLVDQAYYLHISHGGEEGGKGVGKRGLGWGAPPKVFAEFAFPIYTINYPDLARLLSSIHVHTYRPQASARIRPFEIWNMCNM